MTNRIKRKIPQDVKLGDYDEYCFFHEKVEIWDPGYENRQCEYCHHVHRGNWKPICQYCYGRIIPQPMESLEQNP